LFSDLLSQEGLDHHVIDIGGCTRENLIVLEESTGRQFRFGMPGPALQDEEWKRCLTELSGIDPRPDYIVASGSLPPGVPEDFYARVARLAKESGSRMIVDASGTALAQALQEGVYLVKPNLREVNEFAGRKADSETDPADLARRIVSSGKSEVVVISTGAAGAMLVTGDGCEHLRAPAVPIKSKVGAGDSMVAGIVLSLARGRPLLEAVRFGVAAGAAAVMTPGTELCRRKDTESLYKRMTSEATK
jgi:6-phosphofructokinase 2